MLKNVENDETRVCLKIIKIIRMGKKRKKEISKIIFYLNNFLKFYFQKLKFLFILFGSRLLWLIEHIRQTTLATILSIKVIGHEDASATTLIWTLTSQTRYLTILVYFVVFEYGQLDFLLFVLDLFGRCVILLLALTTASSQTQHQM